MFRYLHAYILFPSTGCINGSGLYIVKQINKPNIILINSFKYGINGRVGKLNKINLGYTVHSSLFPLFFTI